MLFYRNHLIAKFLPRHSMTFFFFFKEERAKTSSFGEDSNPIMCILKQADVLVKKEIGFSIYYSREMLATCAVWPFEFSECFYSF